MKHAHALLAFVLALLLIGVSPARADDTWRLAGTFNGWNASDDNWRLAPITGEPTNILVLERVLEPGSSSFKFVKNGDWNAGHLGSNGSGGLEQPGNDITLRVAARATYRITLNTNTRTWLLTPAKVDKPVLVTRVLGTPADGVSFIVDAGDSLVNPGSKTSLSIEGVEHQVSVGEVEGQPMRLAIVCNASGPLTLKVTLSDGTTSVTEPLAINVQHRYNLSLKSERAVPITFPGMQVQPEGGVRDGFRILDYQGNGVFRTVILVKEETTIDSLSVVKDRKDVLLSTKNVALKPGTYAVEVRDGKVVTSQKSGEPYMLIPGAWMLYEYKPAADTPRASTVALVGDYNRWATPGTAGAIELTSRLDGSFAAWVNFPEGVYRSRLLLDGVTPALDPNAGASFTGPDNMPVNAMVVGRVPADFPEPTRGVINVDAAHHNPQSPMDFMVIEPDLGLVEISIATLPDDVTDALLHVDLPDASGKSVASSVPMHRSRDMAGFDRWTARVLLGKKDSVTYSFGLIDKPEEFVTRDFTADITPDPRLDLPAWAMGATWYQIFPERFRNGNPLNDPHGPGVFMMDWNDDWYKPGKGEAEAWAKQWLKPGEKMPQRTGGEIYNYIWDRRYGGDLQGVAEKLDELKSLGVTAIYLNPIFEAQSMHKYDASDYRHIDDNFAWPKSAGRVPADPYESKPGELDNPTSWTWTPADRYFIDEFLPACHKRGLHVVIDGVFNHTGQQFFAFADLMKNGNQSAFKDWWYAEFDENGALKSWVSWFNTGALPKFHQTSTGDLVPPVKQHIFNITKRWMDPNGDGDPSDGVDGWRLDVALDVGLPFWKDWRAHVKSINPNAIIIAEIWDDAAQHLSGDAFDTQMNYPFAKAVIDWLGVRPGMSSDQLGRELDAAFSERPQTTLIHQNLFDSHDTDRYVSMLWNPNRGYDQRNRLQDGDGQQYKAGRPPKEIYDLSLVGVAIQATYLGAPMIYYGDEVGMWGADDPTNRKPYPWPDKGRNANRDDEYMASIRRVYKDWFTLRQDPKIGAILRYGSVRHLTTADPDVFAFTRELNGKRVVIVANRGKKMFDAAAILPQGTKQTKVGPVSARWIAVD